MGHPWSVADDEGIGVPRPSCHGSPTTGTGSAASLAGEEASKHSLSLTSQNYDCSRSCNQRLHSILIVIFICNIQGIVLRCIAVKGHIGDSDVCHQSWCWRWWFSEREEGIEWCSSAAGNLPTIFIYLFYLFILFFTTIYLFINFRCSDDDDLCKPGG